MRDGYCDVGVFAVDRYTFGRLVHEIAYHGAWRPVLEFLSAAIAGRTSVRDYIDGEKVIQGFPAPRHTEIDGSVPASTTARAAGRKRGRTRSGSGEACPVAWKISRFLRFKETFRGKPCS